MVGHAIRILEEVGVEHLGDVVLITSLCPHLKEATGLMVKLKVLTGGTGVQTSETPAGEGTNGAALLGMVVHLDKVFDGEHPQAMAGVNVAEIKVQNSGLW